MKIGIITYDAPHLKTEQVVLGLPDRSIHELHFFALPFKSRPSREVRFPHRPDQSAGAHASAVAHAVGAPYTRVKKDTEIPENCDLYLVCGAGILSAECVSNKRILNAHPGAIPAVRGLDALKWALLDNQPLGNTLHYIDAEVDAGEVIAILETPLFASDTFASISKRHYDLEIAMMQNFAYYLGHPRNDFSNLPIGEAHRRLPLSREDELTTAVSKRVSTLL